MLLCTPVLFYIQMFKFWEKNDGSLKKSNKIVHCKKETFFIKKNIISRSTNIYNIRVTMKSTFPQEKFLCFTTNIICILVNFNCNIPKFMQQKFFGYISQTFFYKSSCVSSIFLFYCVKTTKMLRV